MFTQRALVALFTAAVSSAFISKVADAAGVYGYRKQITINSAQVSGSSNLTNFPVLISHVDPDLRTTVNGGRVENDPNGYDIIFRASDGITDLDFEIEDYNASTGEIVAWVRIPSLDHNDNTVLFIYYGNPDIAVSQENAPGVWDPTYHAVWHLKEEQAGVGNTDLYQDSTSNANHGDDDVSDTGQTGQINGGKDFDGIDDRIHIPDPGGAWDFADGGLDAGTSDFSLSAWVLHQSNDGFPTIIAKGGGSSTNTGYWFDYDRASDGLDIRVSDGTVRDIFNSNAGIGLDDGQWHHVAVVFDREPADGTAHFFMDGNWVGSHTLSGIAGNSVSGTANVNIGSFNLGNRPWLSNLDEVRVSATLLSYAWLQTEYNNQDCPTNCSPDPDFYVLGAEEACGDCGPLTVSEGAGTITITAPDYFEMTFDTAAGGTIEKLFDLSEDPLKSHDLAGAVLTGDNPWGLYNWGLESAGGWYNAGNNDSGAELDLLEATPTRVRVRHESFLEDAGSGITLGNVKAFADYSITPPGKITMKWDRVFTGSVNWDSEYHEMMIHYTQGVAPLDTWEIYSESGGGPPPTPPPGFAGERFFVAHNENGAGARTDFIFIIHEDWAEADQTAWYWNTTDDRVNPQWMNTVPGGTYGPADNASWDFLIYFKPTDIGDHTDAGAIGRTDDYRGPDPVSVIGPGNGWNENPDDADFFNESEAAYTFDFDMALGLTFELDGLSTTRYTPFFKIRQWRSLRDPDVTLEGTSLTNDVDFKADVKPISGAHFDAGPVTDLANGGLVGSADEYLADPSPSKNFPLSFASIDTERLYLGSDSKFRGLNYTPGNRGCTVETYGGHTYLFCTGPSNWDDARTECYSAGYHLVTIDNDAENTWLADTASTLSAGSWWMGLNDQTLEGTFVWEDGTPVAYTNWFLPGEPNDTPPGEDCAAFPEHTAYTWNDMQCSLLKPYICERDNTGVGTADLQWQYWDGGSWADLESVAGFTDETTSLTEDGTIYWTEDPSSWTPTSVNGGPDLYYVRAHLASGSYTGFPIEGLIKTDILLFQYCEDITLDDQTFDFGVPLPTAVELVSFKAHGLDEKVELTWETGSEIDNLGFQLYRALSASGPYERITSALIPGLGSSPEGKQYSYTDTGLANGVTYYYKLEDIETTGKTEEHGPVWATPQAAGESGGEETPGEKETPSKADHAVGQPERNRLNILESRTGELVLELITEGFYAVPQDDGTVRLEIPEFGLTEDIGSPAVPVKRTWVPVLAGRQVTLVSVSTFDEETFDGFAPETAGSPAIEVGRGGTIRATRQRRQRVTNRIQQTYYPEQSAQLLATAFQEDVKKALVEMAPLRWDTAQNRLVLAHRLVVRLSMEGRDLAEQTSRSGRRGRRYPRPPAPQEPGRVMTRWVTTEAGLYGVDLSRLLRSRDGAPINPDTLRLSRQGETVPFHIEGNTLYFVSVGGEGNPYGHEAVVELEVGVSGDRMAVGSAAPGGAPTAYYWELIRKEDDLIYQSALVQAPDRWLWKMLFAPAREAVPFDVSALAPTTESSRVKVWLQGASDFAANPDHHVQIYVNGTFVGERSWNGKEAQELDLEIGAGILHDGENLLEVENVDDTDATYSMVMLNRFEVRYPRRLEAVEGYLQGSWSLSGTAEVTGVEPQAHVLEKTPTGFIWLEGAEATAEGIRFQAEAEHSYLVVSPDAVKAPTTHRVSKKNRLKTTTQQADYVLIGPRDFLGAASPLLELRRSQGLKAKAVAMEDITSEFGFGEETPKAIKDFLTYAYHSWDPGPRYVVLAGDGTYDFKDNLKTGVKNHVPPMMVMTSYLETASDPAYAAVNGEDLLPDLAIGRLPAATVDELRTMVSKIVLFETSGKTFGGRAVLVSDNPDRAGDFVADAEALASTALSSKELERIYLSQLGPAATRNQILQAFDEGASLVNYIGHGGIHLWADEDIFNNDDVTTLAHQGEQPLLLTMNCLNGYFHFPYLNALSEELLKADGKGAVAAFSPSGLSVNSAAHVFHRLLLEELVSGGHTRLGDAVLAAQSAYADSGALPEMIAIYHLFGDPAMELR